MKDFTVVVHYEGGIHLSIKANTIDEAKAKAEEGIMDMDYGYFMNYITDTIDWEVCDVWEVK